MATAPPVPSSPKSKTPRSPHSRKFPPGELPPRKSSSVPSSPTGNAQPRPAVDTKAPTKDTAASGTFLTESPKMDERPSSDDAEDPHDLSFNSNHVLRASMVDNLVMSLDQFSSGGLYDDGPYTPRNYSYDTAMDSQRKRGHTFSSSVSSESDIHIKRTPPQMAPRIPLRNSVRNQKNVNKLPSIFGEDEDSIRTKTYDTQRAPLPNPARRRKNTSASGKSNASSNSSSIDLGHLASMAGRLGGPGNRRSRSFDFGSRAYSARATRELDPSSDGAPTPVIYSGPEAQKVPPTPPTAAPLARKNSTRSSKSAHAKRGRTGALGTNTMKAGSNEKVPQLTTMKSVPSLATAAQSQAYELKPHVTEPVPVSKPGFFRRVFGSSSKHAAAVDSHSSGTALTVKHSINGRATPAPDDGHRPTTPPLRTNKLQRRTSQDSSANKENHPVITKKSSAFFRRRKKSTSNSIPPPLPLTLNSDLNKPEPEPVSGQSPVSSLRAFMDPYLIENAPSSGGHARTSSMQGILAQKLPPPSFGLTKDSAQDSSTHSNASAHGRNPSLGSGRTLKSSARLTAALKIPHQDSFLADSSSADEPRKSPLDESSNSELDHSATRSRPSLHELRREQSASSMSLATPASDARMPLPRQGSWQSEKASPSSSTAAIPQSSNASNNGSALAVKQATAKRPTLETSRKGSRSEACPSESDVSEYRSAPSTPMVYETPVEQNAPPMPQVIRPSISQGELRDEERLKAQQIFDNTDDEVNSSNAGGWLGESGAERERVRKAYMELFDWSGQNMLDSLRDLCDHVALKGETQQMDRVLDAFSRRWCECNVSHTFKSSDVVHTLCYSVLLLNTDLHLADIGQKMTKAQFIKNALPTVKRVANIPEPEEKSGRPGLHPRGNTDESVSGYRISRRSTANNTNIAHDDAETGEPTAWKSNSDMGPRDWEAQIEATLRSFYSSISQQPLPLFGAPADVVPPAPASSNFLTIGTNMLRRTPSVLSKAHSDTNRGRVGGESRSLGARWMAKGRSRPRLPSAPGFGSSRTSIDEQSSAWSPSMSSTWSKVSLGKTLTSMSVDSFGTEATHNDYQSSIGFASALSQAIIRDDQLELTAEEGVRSGSLLEDESLELCGAPWAKEGIVKHKCHLEGVDKRSKDRNWNDCFAVIEKGWMRLFSFNMTAKSLRNKARAPKAGAIVGGGNWQDNAEEVWQFMLRHTIASSLPPPGYSKARPYVWALSLPTGAVHLFSVGTPDIVKEFVSTANFWSARLSKEPMVGGISNMEYGWSDSVVNRALMAGDSQSVLNSTVSPRPSTQMSMRSSMDQVGTARPKLPGDRIHIADWTPPQQTMFPSQLVEADQLQALHNYVHNIEEELQRHNELRGLMILAFSAKHPNGAKAMSNWEKKSSYLLREIVKFRTYIDALEGSKVSKERIYRMRREEELSQRAEIDSRATSGQPVAV